MYAKSSVDERLAIAAKEFSLTPEPHTVAEVIAFDEHLTRQNMYHYDDQGRIDSVQNLTEFESAWMLNEQVLVQCDASYALTRYAFIKDEQNIIRRFQFRLPQEILFGVIQDLELLGGSIELMCLKARQLGVSTLIILLVALRIIFSYGVNAVIGSADQTKTSLMANMLFLFYDMLPVWLRPRTTRRVESDRGMLVFGQTAAGVSFQHGAQTSGIARGTTPTVYLLSECASFTDPVAQIEAALFKAVHASPAVFGVLESTGEGDKGWWPDTWRDSKLKWPKRRARLCPKFLPWFCGVDMYPTPTWLRMRPVPSDWTPNHDTREHVAKSELYVKSDPMLERGLLELQRRGNEYQGSTWHMPRAQQWFWEVEHEQAKSKNIESVFLQEMAGDDEEALQRSAESAFGHETIIEIQERRAREYVAYGLSGQSIEDAHEPPPEDIDYSAERLPVRYSSPRNETYRWDFIPLRFASPLSESDPADAIGKLFIFHPPRPNVSYSIGVDTSEGKGQDATVISVWSVGTRSSADIQCAEFASPYVNHVEAFAFVLAIAAHYGQYMSQGLTRWRQPYVSIEQVAAVGDTCQLQMQRMGYSNFHRMGRYDSSIRRIAKQKRSSSSKRGWYTYGWSRPLLTGNFVHSAQNGWAEINSPWLIDEMKHFEVHITSTGKERLEHEEGQHDDRIFAAAMAIFCPHDMDALADRSKKRLTESTSYPPIDTGEYRGNVVNLKDTTRKSLASLEDIMYSDANLERLSR